jgi:hypothetical protein
VRRRECGLERAQVTRGSIGAAAIAERDARSSTRDVAESPAMLPAAAFVLFLPAPSPAVVAPASAAIAVAPAVPAAVAAERPPDPAALAREAQGVQRADVLAWRRYRFHRAEKVEELTQEGSVAETHVMEHEITPLQTSFDERLLRIDGREPTDDEVRDARRKGSFQKHYETLLEGAEEEGSGGYSVMALLRLSGYAYAGLETIQGVPCHRLDFTASEPPSDGDLAARIAAAMQGTLWLSVEGLHLVRARADSAREVGAAIGLFRLHALRFAVDAAAVAPDVWLPTEVMVETRMRLVVVGVRRRRTFSYSEYDPAPARFPKGPPLPTPGG